MDINPYEAPRSAKPSLPEVDFSEHAGNPIIWPPFISPRRRSALAIGLAALFMVALATSAFAYYSQVRLVGRIMQGASLVAGEAERHDQWVEGIQRIRMVAYYAMMFTLLSWIYRVCKNLRSFGAERLDYTPGWAVGWYFVPFLNIVRPYQVMREIWLASDPDYVGEQPWRWRKGRTNKLILVGWVATILWISSNIICQTLSTIAMTEQPSPQKLAHLHEVSGMQVVIDLAGVICFVNLCVIIWTIDKRQMAAHARVEQLIEARA